MTNERQVSHYLGDGCEGGHCYVCSAKPCASTVSLHGESPGLHWWSGWPGAICLKCGSEDPQEACLAEGCFHWCHEDMWKENTP